MSFDVNGSLIIYYIILYYIYMYYIYYIIYIYYITYIYIYYIHIKLYCIILYYTNIWMFPSLGECRFPQIWPWKLRCLCADQCSCWDPKSQRAQRVVTKMAGSGWNWWMFIPPNRGHVSQPYFGLETQKKRTDALFRNLLYIYMYLFLIHAHMYPKVVCSRNLWISWYVCCSQRQRSTGTWRWSVCGWIPPSRCAPWSSARRCGWVKWGG